MRKGEGRTEKLARIRNEKRRRKKEEIGWEMKREMEKERGRNWQGSGTRKGKKGGKNGLGDG